jgi:hypothetical protein
MRQEQKRRQNDRADWVNVPERIQSDAACFFGRVVAEVAGDISVRGFVKRDRHDDRDGNHRQIQELIHRVPAPELAGYSFGAVKA